MIVVLEKISIDRTAKPKTPICLLRGLSEDSLW
jgi:hypothetical protein